MSSGRYFSVPKGRTADVAPESEGIINTEETRREPSGVDDGELASVEQKKLGRNFPRKRHRSSQLSKPVPADSDEDDDPYAGPAPIDDAKLEKYSRGQQLSLKGIRNDFFKQKFKKKRRQYDTRATQAARAELLLPEEAGFIEPEENEATYLITQKEIVDSVDILSATKHFELDLRTYGPYRCDYTNNGRHLLLGGRKTHVAAIDWVTKELLCEVGLMETVRDVKWLHNELIFAVAQKRWTYLYDNKGTELHCLKNLFQARRLDFLPYHFLLVAATSTSFLHWLDVSMGKLVRSTPTKQGPLDVMCINPANAVTHLGTNKGTVTLWSPNVKEPLVRMFCHGSPVRGLTVDSSGTYMATTGADRILRIWDLRKYGNLYTYKLPRVGEPLTFSQRRVLAAGVGTQVQLFRDPCTSPIVQPYLVHDCREMITGLQFCPYEDVLGVGHRAGFVSLLVPGSGEPNFDAYEANPYQTKKQRRETEVRRLLDKIQPEMITLDAELIGRVDGDSLQRKLEDKLKTLYMKKPKMDVEVKHKAKGKGGTAQKEHRKKAMKDQQQREFLREQRAIRKELIDEGVLSDEDSRKKKMDQNEPEFRSALDRFTKQKI